jgi:hypothetical protein
MWCLPWEVFTVGAAGLFCAGLMIGMAWITIFD